jgi:hypothetical protein
VLHLSSKWEFVHARAAATQAIPPLASPVDKIVLGRTYDLPQWLPDAFADVLGREQAINIQEARRMTLEDLVTIANGRVAARADAVKPRAEIEEIARSGLGLTPGQLTKVDNADLAKALDVTPSVTGEQIAENAQTERQFQEEQIVRWIAQTNTTPGSKTAWNCLHSYTSRHTWSRPYIMAQVLKEGLGVFTSDVVAGCLNRPSAYCKSSLRLDPIMASVVRIMAWPGTNGYSASPQAVQQAHHEAVDYWKGFEDLPYSLGPTNVLKGQPFTALIISTNFMDYMVTHRSLVNSEIYSAFWDALRTIFQKPSLAVHVACVATVVTEALNQLSYCVAKLNVGVEQDTFYHIVDRAATSARQQGRVDDLKALEVRSTLFPLLRLLIRIAAPCPIKGMANGLIRDCSAMTAAQIGVKTSY